jgi:hypothetical protein
MNDVGGIPLILGENLQKAKGSYTHQAVQGVKAAASGAANLISQPKEMEEKPAEPLKY